MQNVLVHGEPFGLLHPESLVRQSRIILSRRANARFIAVSVGKRFFGLIYYLLHGACDGGFRNKNRKKMCDVVGTTTASFVYAQKAKRMKVNANYNFSRCEHPFVCIRWPTALRCRQMWTTISKNERERCFVLLPARAISRIDLRVGDHKTEENTTIPTWMLKRRMGPVSSTVDINVLVLFIELLIFH